MSRHCINAFRIAAPAATTLVLAAFSACAIVPSANASDGGWKAADNGTAQRLHPDQRNPSTSNAATAPSQWTASRARSTGVTQAVPAASVTRENAPEAPQNNREAAH